VRHLLALAPASMLTRLLSPAALDWHPSHPDLLVSGGGEGSMHFWSLKASDPTVPVHSMETAHDSNIWSMAWHPLGHVLASGSNDHTTRFWERARPEDGRREEGDSAGLEKAARWKSAAKGGEEWDGACHSACSTSRAFTDPPPQTTSFPASTRIAACLRLAATAAACLRVRPCLRHTAEDSMARQQTAAWAAAAAVAGQAQALRLACRATAMAAAPPRPALAARERLCR
jgi:hypothetical protein